MISYTLMLNLSRIQRPSRYIDSEFNVIRKEAPLRVALAFPDAYEVGMSHLGLKVLYHIINSLPFASAERVFHPWLDMEEAMRASDEPLRSLESGTPLGGFDVVGFSLQYELAYPSMLNMLDLGGLPVRSAERGPEHPLVIAGGPCTVNPMPIAPFVDAALVGDGEEALPEILEVINGFRGSRDRGALMKALANIEGVYVPSIHKEPGSVRRRIISSLEDAPYPTSPVVPYMQIVHDRIAIEVSRGCTMGCRFCQAGMMYRPLRERSPERVLELAERAIADTGHDEVAFTSLSAGDYSCLYELIRNFNSRFSGRRISVSLPSLRVAAVNREILREISSVRKTGFTIAPEAATERLRAVINKDFSQEDFERSVSTLFSEGWLGLKLYYMIGLPTETAEDIEAIPAMVNNAYSMARKIAKRGVNINVSVSPFVPKAHTPFQRQGFMGTAYINEKLFWLKRNIKRAVFKSHDARNSLLEAALARSGAEGAELVEAAWRQGARLDAWSESFDMERWHRAQDATGIDIDALAGRTFDKDDTLPWEVVDSGISRKYLEREYASALEGRVTKDCSSGDCAACGLKCKPGEGKVPGLREPVSLLMQRPQSPVRKHIRVRVLFEKTGMLRYLSHRELITAITRALNRAGVELAYSQGFHPQPKVALGPPLSVGMEGTGEYFDMEMLPLRNLSELAADINSVLPEGLRLLRLEAIDQKAPALQAFIKRYVYDICGAEASGAASFLAAKEHIIDRKGKPLDIRPMLESLDTGREGGWVRVTLRDTSDKGARVDEICEALFSLEASELEIRRTAMYGLERGQWKLPMKEAPKG